MKQEMKQELWEILVPASNNKDQNFSYKHHKEWDAFVKKITNGLTIMKTAKGEWISPTGKIHVDRTIPCKIVCNEKQINEIIDFTLTHYNQEAVLAYRISTNIILKHKTKLQSKPPKPPKPPVGRIIKEGIGGSCPLCHSTEVKKYHLFGKKIGCIQPECKNYYKSKLEEDAFL